MSDSVFTHYDHLVAACTGQIAMGVSRDCMSQWSHVAVSGKLCWQPTLLAMGYDVTRGTVAFVLFHGCQNYIYSVWLGIVVTSIGSSAVVQRCMVVLS